MHLTTPPLTPVLGSPSCDRAHPVPARRRFARGREGTNVGLECQRLTATETAMAASLHARPHQKHRSPSRWIEPAPASPSAAWPPFGRDHASCLALYRQALWGAPLPRPLAPAQATPVGRAEHGDPQAA